MEKFTGWFFTEIIGVWFIWASYMAVKFIIEDAQSQKASFSITGGHGQVGGFIVIPIILTVVYSFLSAFWWGGK